MIDVYVNSQCIGWPWRLGRAAIDGKIRFDSAPCVVRVALGLASCLRINVTLTSIPVKTPEGLAELRERSHHLSQRHRTVLLLVDGRRALIEVQTLALQAGSPPSCMDDLLALGLVVISQPTVPVTRYSAEPPTHAQQPDVWLPSVLPSQAASEIKAAVDHKPIEAPSHEASLPEAIDATQPADKTTINAAREILLRAVRQEAPLAGSLTLLRLRKARTADDLRALLDEVEVRISKPQRMLTAQQTLSRVRQLLSGQAEPQPPIF